MVSILQTLKAQHRLSVNVINNLKPGALATTKRELNLINLQFGRKFSVQNAYFYD